MRKKHNIGGRANLLEEMGRIDARRTKREKKNARYWNSISI